MTEHDRLVNLTGHELFITNDLNFTVLKPGHGRAKVDSRQDRVGTLHLVAGLEVPLLCITEQEIVGLPDKRKGVWYVVSGVVAALAGEQGREDVVTPGRVERNGGNGRVMSARALIRIERGSHGS